MFYLRDDNGLVTQPRRDYLTKAATVSVHFMLNVYLFDVGTAYLAVATSIHWTRQGLQRF